MYSKEKTSTLKIVLTVIGVMAIITAVVAGVLYWKKKKDDEKKLEEEIEALIEQKFAEAAEEE